MCVWYVSASACLRLGPGALAVPVSCPTPSAPLPRPRCLLSARLATEAVFISWLCVSVCKRLLRMGPIPPTARPAGFSPHPPSATLFILDPSPGGAHGQGLLPEPELGPPPRDCPGPLRSDPSAGKSGHPVSAGPGPGPRWVGKPVLTPKSRPGSRARPARGG